MFLQNTKNNLTKLIAHAIEDEVFIGFEGLIRSLKMNLVDFNIHEDESVAVLFYDSKFNQVYSHIFNEYEMALINEDLLPTMVSTIQNLFQNEQEIIKTKQFYFNNHEVVFQQIQDLIICVVMKGRSFSAFYKLDSLINIINLSPILFLSLRSKKIGELESQQLMQLISQIFQSQGFDYDNNDTLIQEAKIRTEIQQEYLISEIPDKVSKLIVHPVRLNIVKILCDNVYLTRNVLQKFLNIKSGTLERHLDILEAEQIIESFFGLIKDRPNKVILITSNGRNYYQSLINALNN